MKWRYSKKLAFSVWLAAGLCTPAAGSTEVLTGMVLQVHREQNRLLLEPAPQAEQKNSTLTVTFAVPTTGQNLKKHTRLPACILPGKVVQVQGSYTDKDQSMFQATTIRGMQRRYKDATGVRARLESCRHEQITSQENIPPDEFHN